MPARLREEQRLEQMGFGEPLVPRWLGFGIRVLDERLGVPDWIEPGDTPTGEPAVWWKPGSTINGRAMWNDGGTASQAFWKFLGLAHEQRLETFVAFARRFGPLGLWEYQTPARERVAGLTDYWVPTTAEGIWTPRRFDGPIDGELWRRMDENDWLGVLYEPISEWRRWAMWFLAALRIGSRLRRSELASRSDWEASGYGWFWDGFGSIRIGEELRDIPTNLAKQRDWFAGLLHVRFLRWAGLTPVVVWDGPAPDFTLSYLGDDQYQINTRGMSWVWPRNSLYPALVLQLLALVSGGNVATCETCGEPHQRKRGPRSDQPIRCPNCRRAARNESNARSAQRRRLAMTGTSTTR